MFIPGVGAFVRLQEQLATPVENARVGLGGPIWGLAAAGFAWTLAYGLQSPMWDAIAQAGAWINLFNLTPIWQLDGARAFHALDRTDRALAAGAVLAAFMWTKEGMLLLVLLFGIIQIFTKNVPASGDRRTLFEYITLVGLLSMIAYIRVAPGAIGLR
jgi:Zn-dependent protease